MPGKALRRRVRRMIDFGLAAFIDFRLWVTGKADRELPPLRLRFVGGGDFRETGRELTDLLVSAGGLRRSDRVLDIGCGVGRVAIPLAAYLDPGASYDGFDVVRRGIRWCERNITPRHPNFRFHHVDVSSSEYRTRGSAASAFRFPFADASFDFAFATSVFTHLVAHETRRYIEETARVLAPGGRFLATFFLITDESRAAMDSRTIYHFPCIRGPMRLLDGDNPAAGVAIDEAVALRLLTDAGLRIERVSHGQWSGRAEFLTFQDVVQCAKAG
ncbi:MAG TPA: class I SAM-dependent methyltransferase [Thermoanaerobaculia bacterium]|nr:class I SAM-dependent methyltransferase [Thermoanaerobaculia bacterium]